MDGGKAVPGGRNMLMEESGLQLLNDVYACPVEWQGSVRQAVKKRKIISC